MRTIQITIEGTTPLLMNKFKDAATQALKRGSSNAVRARQNLEPRDAAETKLYQDENGTIHIPGPNLFRAFIDAGTFIKIGKGKMTTQKTSLVPAGMAIIELACPLSRPDGAALTWEVDERSVVNPATGGRMMAYRPRFERWQLSLTVEFDPEMFNEQLVRELVDHAGKRIGLGDFRPSRKGPFGKFVVTRWQADDLKKEKNVT